MHWFFHHPWQIVFNDELLPALRAGALPKLDHIHDSRRTPRDPRRGESRNQYHKKQHSLREKPD
jgi:hypothetical protein